MYSLSIWCFWILIVSFFCSEHQNSPNHHQMTNKYYISISHNCSVVKWKYEGNCKTINVELFLANLKWKLDWYSNKKINRRISRNSWRVVRLMCLLSPQSAGEQSRVTHLCAGRERDKSSYLCTRCHFTAFWHQMNCY